MKDLDIYIEIKGEQVKAGEIRAAGDDCVFRYSDEYMRGIDGSGMQSGVRQGGPISISLPFQDEPFTPEQTRNFFSGLLPEGFMRRRVSELAHVGEGDYTEILADLGSECIGAIKALPADHYSGGAAGSKVGGSAGGSEGLNGSADNSKGPGGSADNSKVSAGGSKGPGGTADNSKVSASHKADYIKLSDDEIAALAGEGVVEASELVMKAHLSLTGASGKVGLYLDPVTKEWFLPVGEAPSTHIVKQSHIRLGSIIANEQLCLMTAKKLGITVPESFIIKMGGNRDSQVLLATERFDRKWADDSCLAKELTYGKSGEPASWADSGDGHDADNAGGHVISGHKRPYRLHQEDFAQALGIPAQDKYESPGDHYLEKAFKLLLDYSARPVEDQIKLWKIVIFDYLIGNTDNHIKNISLLYSENLSSCRLAPAYDMLSTSIYEMSTDNMAFSIGGDMSIADITRESFGREAVAVGINEAVAYRQFDRMAKSFIKALTASADDLIAKGFTNAGEIKDRILETGGIAKI